MVRTNGEQLDFGEMHANANTTTSTEGIGVSPVISINTSFETEFVGDIAFWPEFLGILEILWIHDYAPMHVFHISWDSNTRGNLPTKCFLRYTNPWE